MIIVTTMSSLFSPTHLYQSPLSPVSLLPSFHTYRSDVPFINSGIHKWERMGGICLPCLTYFVQDDGLQLETSVSFRAEYNLMCIYPIFFIHSLNGTKDNSTVELLWIELQKTTDADISVCGMLRHNPSVISPGVVHLIPQSSDRSTWVRWQTFTLISIASWLIYIPMRSA